MAEKKTLTMRLSDLEAAFLAHLEDHATDKRKTVDPDDAKTNYEHEKRLGARSFMDVLRGRRKDAVSE